MHATLVTNPDRFPPISEQTLRGNDYVEWVNRPDGTLLAVGYIAHGARLYVNVHNNGYEDCYDYCYDASSLLKASVAMDAFAESDLSEPQGWTRHPISGRCRPMGDPAAEESSR